MDRIFYFENRFFENAFFIANGKGNEEVVTSSLFGLVGTAKGFSSQSKFFLKPQGRYEFIINLQT